MQGKHPERTHTFTMNNLRDRKTGKGGEEVYCVVKNVYLKTLFCWKNGMFVQSSSDYNNSLFYLDFHSNGHSFTPHTSGKEINKDRFSLCWPTHSAHVPVVSLCGFSTVALTGGSSAGVKERKQEVFAVCYQLFVTPTANYSTQPEQLPHHSGGKRSCCTCGGGPVGLRKRGASIKEKVGVTLGISISSSKVLN